MPDRRAFISGLFATGLCAARSWASAGNPSFLSAARKPDGRYVLCGLTGGGQMAFDVPLPARGHAAAAHPDLAQAVAFARRPGQFALVIDCISGGLLARLDAPPGRHFYGHGTFSNDGKFLFTTENDYETATGLVGIWDAHDTYRRLGEFSSGGIGPHDIKPVPGSDLLVVANGGIETHPETGRAKLNIPSMRPNLSYISYSGALIERVEPPKSLHKNSMRHLAVHGDGSIAIACQWQGDLGDTPALLATHRRGQPLRLHASGIGLERRMQGYAGSVAASAQAGRVAVTGPRGGLALEFDTGGTFLHALDAQDICGAAPLAEGFAFTTGSGHVLLRSTNVQHTVRHPLQWDNHLIAL